MVGIFGWDMNVRLGPISSTSLALFLKCSLKGLNAVMHGEKFLGGLIIDQESHNDVTPYAAMVSALLTPIEPFDEATFL